MPTTLNSFNGTQLVLLYDAVIVGHSVDFTFKLDSAVIDTTTRNSSGWGEKIYGLRSWSISVSGLLAYDDVGNANLYMDAIVNRGVHTVTFGTGLPGDPAYSGSVKVTSISQSAKMEAAVTYSATLVGTGPLTTTNTIVGNGALVTYNANFNAAAQSIASWTDVTGDPGQGAVSAILAPGYSVGNVAAGPYNSSKYTGINTSNTLGNPAATIVPPGVGVSGWVKTALNNGAGYEAKANGLIAFVVPAGGVYTVSVFSSLASPGTGMYATSQFYAQGLRSNTQTVSYIGNAASLATFSGLVPDITNTIWIIGEGLSAVTASAICINGAIISRTA